MIEFENRLSMSGTNVPSGEIGVPSADPPLEDAVHAAGEQGDGRRYSGFRFFAGLILAIGVSLAIWVAVIYVYSMIVAL